MSASTRTQHGGCVTGLQKARLIRLRRQRTAISGWEQSLDYFNLMAYGPHPGSPQEARVSLLVPSFSCSFPGRALFGLAPPKGLLVGTQANLLGMRSLRDKAFMLSWRIERERYGLALAALLFQESSARYELAA